MLTEQSNQGFVKAFVEDRAKLAVRPYAAVQDQCPRRLISAGQQVLAGLLLFSGVIQHVHLGYHRWTAAIVANNSGAWLS